MAENIKLVIDRSELYDLLAQNREALDSTKQAKVEADTFLSNEGEEIKDTDMVTKRVLRMLPGLREAQRLQKSMGQLEAGNIMGALNIALLAVAVLNQVMRLYEEQKRKQKQYEQDLMQAQGFATRSEFKQYETQQKTALKQSRTVPR
ncbi:MAG: hypothetical protein LBE70_03715 [Nitrososphaerota archaeon]|nr:hypothetical protein [Nitrososphaerota archaeon]